MSDSQMEKISGSRGEVGAGAEEAGPVKSLDPQADNDEAPPGKAQHSPEAEAPDSVAASDVNAQDNANPNSRAARIFEKIFKSRIFDNSLARSFSLLWMLIGCVAGALVVVYMLRAPIMRMDDYITRLRDYQTMQMTPDVVACDGAGTCRQHVLLLDGSIDKDAAARLKQVVADNHLGPGTYVCVNSHGGVVEQAFMMGRFIAENQMNTCMAEHYGVAGSAPETWTGTTTCESACPFIVAAGRKRELLGFALLGLHDIRTLEGDISDRGRDEIARTAHDAFEVYATNMEGSPSPLVAGKVDILKIAAQTHSTTMRFIQPQQSICEYGFFNSATPTAGTVTCTVTVPQGTSKVSSAKTMG